MPSSPKRTKRPSGRTPTIRRRTCYTWPKEVEDKYDFANGYFANEVKISKLADPNPKKWQEAAKSWPADTDFLMHGTYENQKEDWFQIKDRTGTLRKFFLTKRSERVQLTDESNKMIGFYEMHKPAQKKMLTVVYQRGKYFADPLTPNESRLFKTTYKDQIAPLIESVDPLDDKLNGVVQLRGWLYNKDKLPHEAGADSRFLRYVVRDWPQEGVDINREAWIAQEDLWIQKEIFRIIKSANDGVSNFTPLGPLPLPAKPVAYAGKSDERNKAYAFRNSYFDLELTLDKEDTLSFKIKNRLARKQSIDLSFRVLLNNAKGFKEEIIKISGFPLEPAGAKDRDYFVQSIPKGKDERTGVYSVQQVLNWQTAAVKRIDQISIGSNDTGDMSHSQRTFPTGLRPLDEDEAKKRAEAKGGGAGPAKGGAKGAGPMPADQRAARPREPFAQGQGPGTSRGGSGDPLRRRHGLWTDRYVEVTEQARRLPVAVVLIVDQDHVDRVLTAFNNSKFRFLETQVLLNQYAGSLQPPAAGGKRGRRRRFPRREADDPGPIVPKFAPRWAVPPGRPSSQVQRRRPGNQHGARHLRHRDAVPALSAAAAVGPA